MDHMHSAFPVSELYDMAQDIDHHAVILFFFIDMRRDKRYKTSLLCIQLDRVEHALEYDLCIERSVDVIRYTHFVGSADHKICVLTGDHNDRDIFNPMIPVHAGQHFKTVHDRHHDIQKDK